MKVLAGTGALVRLALRRERIVMPAWIALVVLFVVGTASYYADLFPTEQARANYAEEIRSVPALRAFGGQIFDPSSEAVAIWRASDTAYALIGLIALLSVVRHTRAEEESGRQELLGAGVVGRYAPLTASLVVAWGAVSVAGMLVSLGLVVLVGLEPVGSLAFGLAIVAVGWVFAAVASLTAQVFERSRTAIGAAAAVLGASYVLRFVADGSGWFWLKWLTPIGWSHFVRPFAGERWWVLGLSLAAFLVMAGVSYLLVARRDFGSGLLPDRLGPATGPGLRGPLALAWRLQRGLLLGWMIGLGAAGVLFGGLVGAATSSPELVTQSPELQEFIRRYTDSPDATLQQAFLWLICLMFGYTVALYPALATLRLRSEEVAGHAEPVLATAVGRLRWAGSHLAFAALGTVAVMAAGGTTAGLAYGLVGGDLATQFPRVLAGALIQVPAVWVLGGVTMLAFGVLPRFAVAVSWAGFLFIQFFEVLGPILGVDFGVVETLVPFFHLPKILSGGEFTATPLVMLTGVTLLLTAAGLFAFGRRDIA